MLDAEALLLVDDDQAQVGEADIVGKQAVGADDDIDLAAAEGGEGGVDLFLGLEA